MLGWDRGSYAEYAIVKDGEAATKPDRLSDEEGAAVPLAALTAWQGLFDHGGLEKGQRVLIHGGAGGVGHFAVQFAHWKGANIAATASHEDLDFVRGLGADEVVDYKNKKFEEKVRDVDLVFDLVGGETQARSSTVLKPGGMLVSTLQAPDEEQLRRHNVKGTHYMAKPNSAELSNICRLIAMGKVSPVVSKRFPLVEAAKAQAELERGHIRGKVVLDCRV
ncbi:MAG: NADP-dependent oxidoreductase [Rhodomicrobium sp.]